MADEKARNDAATRAHDRELLLLELQSLRHDPRYASLITHCSTESSEKLEITLAFPFPALLPASVLGEEGIPSPLAGKAMAVTIELPDSYPRVQWKGCGGDDSHPAYYTRTTHILCEALAARGAFNCTLGMGDSRKWQPKHGLRALAVDGMMAAVQGVEGPVSPALPPVSLYGLLAAEALAASSDLLAAEALAASSEDAPTPAPADSAAEAAALAEWTELCAQQDVQVAALVRSEAVMEELAAWAPERDATFSVTVESHFLGPSRSSKTLTVPVSPHISVGLLTVLAARQAGDNERSVRLSSLDAVNYKLMRHAHSTLEQCSVDQDSKLLLLPRHRSCYCVDCLRSHVEANSTLDVRLRGAQALLKGPRSAFLAALAQASQALPSVEALAHAHTEGALRAGGAGHAEEHAAAQGGQAAPAAGGAASAAGGGKEGE